jgi:hypothetical protein
MALNDRVDERLVVAACRASFLQKSAYVGEAVQIESKRNLFAIVQSVLEPMYAVGELLYD